MTTRPNSAPPPVTLVTMLEDFVTDVGGVGRRTYQKGKTYIASVSTLAAIRKAKVAEESQGFAFQTVRPKFDTITVLSLVTRWFTSTGSDTWHLESGRKASVPSNLAVWLIKAGYAEAV